MKMARFSRILTFITVFSLCIATASAQKNKQTRPGQKDPIKTEEPATKDVEKTPEKKQQPDRQATDQSTKRNQSNQQSTPSKRNSDVYNVQPVTSQSSTGSKPSDTFLTADTKSTSFSHNGGDKTINVSTDASTWVIDSYPSFLSINGRDDKAFSVYCQPNKGGDRTGYIVLKTPEQRFDIKVTQAGGQAMKINRFWMETGAIREGMEGMIIHLDITISGLRNHEIRANTYFEHANGDKLLDRDDNYGTTDGQVCTGTTFVADSDNAHFDDISMFIPYDQFHLQRGDHTLKFLVQIYDNTADTFLGTTKRQTFRYSL